MSHDLLIELLTEELPPRSLMRLSEVFTQQVYDSLKEKGFLTELSLPTPFATPRRLALRVSAVLVKQPHRAIERKGPAVSVALDVDGQPTAALHGFARSCGVAITALKQVTGDKGAYFIYSATQKGEPLKNHLATIVETCLKRLPIAKLMRWSDSDVHFVRPVHGLVMLHGDRVIPGKVLGIKSGRRTRGHRFMSRGPITIGHVQDYEKLLAQRGTVIVETAERMRMIERQLYSAAKKVDRDARWSSDHSSELVKEVASLVEYPTIYAGSFDPEFLKVPKECLVLSMQQHQRYFPLAKNNNELLPHFLFVSNVKAKTPRHIVNGNERVLRARLADAKFFYDQDRKTPLAALVPKLGSIVYHAKLGSQLQRVERIKRVAIYVARELKADIQTVETAASLCKADLLTAMVGEFPELQGTMGYYYAHQEGLSEACATALRSHYQPRFALDVIPPDLVGICVALADKVDALVGLYGIGLVPTGEKDPYGLRRQALGVLRILAERPAPLDVLELLNVSHACYPTGLFSEHLVHDLQSFLLERFPAYLRDQGFVPDEIESVLTLRPVRFDRVIPRLVALQEFRKLPEAKALATANKRIRNILRQAEGEQGANISEVLLTHPAEKELARAVDSLRDETRTLLKAGDYSGVLIQLARLRLPVDKFFDEVMVLVDDQALRKNRLALLNKLSALFLQVADISSLQG